MYSIIISIIPILVCMLFGTAIPTSLNNYLSSIHAFFWFSDCSMERFGVQETANILIKVSCQWWIEHSSLENTCEYHSTVFWHKRDAAFRT